MTAQYPDLINYQGKQYPLFSNPLDSYFNEHNPRPDLKALSTANWRGYIAEWEIEDNALYLDNLRGWIDGDHRTYAVNACEIGIENLFHGVFNGPVKATWFPGTLRIPQGELLEYVHMDYESVYDQDILLTIEKDVWYEQMEMTTDPFIAPLESCPGKAISATGHLMLLTRLSSLLLFLCISLFSRFWFHLKFINPAGIRRIGVYPE